MFNLGDKVWLGVTSGHQVLGHHTANVVKYKNFIIISSGTDDSYTKKLVFCPYPYRGNLIITNDTLTYFNVDPKYKGKHGLEIDQEYLFSTQEWVECWWCLRRLVPLSLRNPSCWECWLRRNTKR